MVGRNGSPVIHEDGNHFHKLQPRSTRYWKSLSFSCCTTGSEPREGRRMTASRTSPIDGQNEVTACLAEILDLDPEDIDPDRKLTELGLDSFAAVRLRRRLLDDLGVDLPLTAFLNGATPGTVAAAVTADAAGGTEPFPLTPIQTAYLLGRDPSLPLGGVATHFYFEYDRRPGAAPEADLDALEQAWNRLVDHHPMLRLVIDDEARQQVLPEVPLYRIPITDLRNAALADAEREAEGMRAALSHRPPAVDRWPLFDIRAALLPDGRTRLFVGMDIIALDMAGWMQLMREWGRITADPGLILPAPATTFAAALARRAQDPAEAARRARGREYWQVRAAALPPGPALPWRASAQELGTPRFTRHAAELTATEWSKLRSRASTHGVSATAVLLAALATVLGRWGATGPFCLNTTLFDRPDDEDLQSVVGDFTTTVLTECAPPDLSGDGGFARYAATINHRFWTDLDHRSISAVEVLRGRGDGGLTPAYPVVFTSGVGLSATEDSPTAWLGDEVFGVSQTPQILIDHIVWEDGGRLRVAWDVVDGCLPDGFAPGIRDAHLWLLRRLAGEERAWTDPAFGWDPSFRPDEPLDVSPFGDCGPLIDDPLRAAAHRAPHDVALLHGDAAVSHGELAERVRATASVLAGHGLGPGDMVAVAAPKGIAQIVATLGVTASGAGYVPVEPSWPAARIASVCAQAGIRHALVTGMAPASWPDTVEVHPLGDDGVPAGGGDAEPRTPQAGDLAYAIFTSGSTGRPKGVAVEHRQVRTTLDDMADRFLLDSRDRVLALSALSFDLSVYDVFGVLGAGGAMVLPDADRQRDPGYWLELMRRHRVSVWNTAPALLEMLVEYAEIEPAAATSALSTLRLVLLSGDWIPVTLPDRVRSLAPHARIISLGGATEASIWSICHPIDVVDPAWPSIPYGRALRGQSFHILDSEGRPCPVGETGELFIGGDGVAAGYLGDPEQTAQRFTTHPVLRRRTYRTGDLGRWRYDGTIEFLGRVDRQVKIRGHRIELGEIEAVLSRAPGVRRCVARSVPGPDGGARLVAYVATGDGETPVADQELITRLREYLPEYMIPSRFVHLAALPVTANGKVDHDRLDNPFRPHASAPEKAAEPPVTVQQAPPEAPTAPPATGEDLTALLVDAARSGLDVRVKVGAGRLDVVSALRTATELAGAARALGGSYRVVPKLDGEAVLGLQITADAVPAPTVTDQSVAATTATTTPDPATEQLIAAVFAELLDTPIDVTKPFFDLGATSLTLIRAHRRLTQRLGVSLAMVDMFTRPTVRDLARLIADHRHPAAPSREKPIAVAPGHDRAAGRRAARALAARTTL
ncbi:non-ribosomal peptide synthetase [Micromonospora sp. MH33]|uniref:non-ribosomal peptide synthetase n=1 Tax=Micromonospora sp. MH33 TaxID=1945509 RepID=UPI000D14A164|nr:non-ribosomal peptide synthetase [Micromonospora sp. MH33]